MSKRIFLALASLGVATISSAKPISDISQITSLRKMLTITFTEQRFSDDHSISDLGQPFEKYGLILPSQKLKDLGGNSGLNGGEAIVSTEIDKTTNSNIQTLAFVFAQKEVGFDLSDELATQITVTAYDRLGNELESVTLPGSKQSRFVGFSRDKAEITQVKISAAHASLADAMSSPTTVDDITFASPLAIDSTNLIGAPGASADAFGFGGYSGGAMGGMLNLSLAGSGDMSDDGSPQTGGLRGNTSQAVPLPSGNLTDGGTLGTTSDPKNLNPMDGPIPGTSSGQTSQAPEPASTAIVGVLMMPAILRRRRNRI